MSSRQDELRRRFNLAIEDNHNETEEMPSGRNRCPGFTLIACSFCGMVFGLAMEKGRVFEPTIIRQQMLFENFTMLKMFLSAAGTGAVIFSIVSIFDATKLEGIVTEYQMALRHRTLAGAVLGGALLGTGMTIAGACPGMVMIQLGTQVPSAGWTLLGGFLGALLYGIVDPILPSFLRSWRNQEHKVADEVTEMPFAFLAASFAAILGLAVAGVEHFAPWTTEVEQSGSGIFGLHAWPPYVAGALIGSLQLPIMYTVDDTLGSATSYVTLLSQLVHIPALARPLKYFRPHMSGVINWWQVAYVSGAVLGGYLSARASDSVGSAEGVGTIAGLTGGALMLFGSRMAGGCTSGHGLSGMGLLVLLSFVAVPAMFAGGITTAVILRSISYL